jgi:translation elongation factor EF-Tu-like GTPase
MKLKSITILANVRALTPSEGGSSHPFFAGYRPNMRYVDDPAHGFHPVIVTPLDGSVHSGQSSQCRIKLCYPKYHEGRLALGVKFELCDGPRVRVTGVVEAIEESDVNS